MSGDRAAACGVLARSVWWDLRVQWRSRIITVAAGTTALYCIGLQLVSDTELAQRVGLVLVFSDPTTIGFLFVGVLVLFERSAGTLKAILVTPLTSAQYLWSKALSLTAVATLASCTIAISLHGLDFDLPLFAAATALTATFLTFLGLAAVARTPTLNAYLVLVPPFLIPLSLPILDYLGLASPLFRVIPTQASLVLLRSAVEGGAWWENLYGFSYLAVATAAAFWWARRSFDSLIRQQGG